MICTIHDSSPIVLEICHNAFFFSPDPVSRGSHKTSYGYDSEGRRESTTSEGWSTFATVTTTREWDDLGRLWKITNPLGTQQINYDGNTGRVTWTKLGVVKSVYSYDTSVPGEHRLSGISHSWNDDWQPYTNHGYSYDSSGRLTSWTRMIPGTGNGTTWAMDYDASEQLQGVTMQKWEGGATTSDEHFYQYDAAGNRTSEQRGGAVRKWEKNALNQLTGQAVGGKMMLRGAVNVPSNVTVTPTEGAAINAANAATTWKAKVDVGAGVNEFTVSATQANVPQGQTAQSTTRTLQVPVGSIPGGEATYQYDADGNMLTDRQRTYTWDAENRLVAVVIPSNGRVEFSYDAFNRRAYEAVKPDGVNATRQLTMMWEGLTVVGQLDGGSGIANPIRLFFGNGERRIMAPGGGANVNLLYTRDHLGSIRELVDASNAAIRARYDYSPYGIRTKLSGDLESDFGYTGHYTHALTGLVLAPYRAYSPELGRWISRDPIAERGGINLYGYVGNGPLQWVDPLGLTDYATSWATGGAAVGFGVTAAASVAADAATGGLNILATPAELALGTAVGGAVGYAAGTCANAAVSAAGALSDAASSAVRWISDWWAPPIIVPTKSWDNESPNPDKTRKRGDHKNRPDGKRVREKDPKCDQPAPEPVNPPSPDAWIKGKPPAPYTQPPKDALPFGFRK